jgi:hypothetical protein
VNEEQVLKALKNELRIEAGIEIARKAVNQALEGHYDDTDWIKRNFSRLVEEIQLSAYHVYQQAEQPAAARAIKDVFAPMLPASATADDLFMLIHTNFRALDRFFLSLTQSRRNRAGKAFEILINVLFSKLSYPYSSQPIINGQPDFLLPSVDHYKANAMDCIIFTVKRTLRERWRQIVTEGALRSNVFLATIDEKVSEGDLQQMLKNRIYLVVPERVKTRYYVAASNVISFETFFEQQLDPAMTRWRKNGILN